MRIKQLSNGLLVAPIQITYNGVTHIVENAVIDTGAVRSVLHVDAVEPLDINPSPTDPISRMYGIGGDDFSFRKQMDSVIFAGMVFNAMRVDFGHIAGINGLIGLDILQAGGFAIDLESLEIYRKDSL